MLVKINPHVLPIQTAWQRRRKDNIFTLPGCAEPICKPLFYIQLPRENMRFNMQSTLHADTYPSALIDWPSESLSPLKPDLICRVATPCRLLTKVITSWLPSIALPHYSAGRGTAVEVENKRRALTLAPGSRLWVRGDTLPALMSRSSWLACPSCCEVAMFSSRCRFTLTSHWVVWEATSSYHSAANGGISSNSTDASRRQWGIPPPNDTGNPSFALLLLRSEDVK